ncbi:MAG TPA: nuclease-related domain-containing protein [Nocardioides sp.]|nr:nuclease-related domain-containing protein [Nocardioides sp.]
MVALLVLTGLTSWMMPTSFLQGLVAGGFLVGGIGALWTLTVQVTGTAPVMMGDTAESWTAMDLRRLQSRGWRIINHFVLAKDDLDHVIIGPGGAFVVETKWSGSPWDSDFGRSRMRAAVVQARANARSLGLWHPMKSRRIPVQPVVVLWGGGAKRKEGIARVDGVLVITGNALRTWVNRLGGEVLTDDQVADAWKALEAQVARRDPLDRATNPVPTSVAALLARAAAAVSGAVVGVIVVGRLVLTIDADLAGLGVGLGLLIPGVIGVRFNTLRFVSWGWLVGVGLPVASLTAAHVFELLSP